MNTPCLRHKTVSDGGMPYAVTASRSGIESA